MPLEDAPDSNSDSGGLDASSHMECPSCHHPDELDDLFCRRCGARLVQRPSYCKRCGDPVDTDEAFCNRCGRSLADEAEEVAEIVAGRLVVASRPRPTCRN